MVTQFGNAGATEECDSDPVTMIRSEERLEVRTVRTATERIRIRKVVVTEERTITLTLRREEIVMEREPLDTTNSGSAGSIGPTAAQPFTIVLHAEQPVIGTQVVPLERVHVLIDTITQMQAVTDEVRAERMELHHTISDLLDRNQE